MLERIHKIYRTNFFKKVSTLFGANIISHIILLFNLFIIARIFRLEDVGDFQVLISYASIAGTYCLLSYQIAIQTSYEKDLAHLVLGSVIIAIFTSFITIIILSLINYKHSFFVGVFTFLSSITLIIDSINIRKQQTHMIGVRKIFQPTFLCGFLILCWLNIFEPNVKSLILASILSVLFSCFMFSKKFLSLLKDSYSDIGKVYSTMRKEFKGSGVLSLSDVLNTSAYNLPTIIIESYFGPVFAAFYSTSLRICNVPITLIADSISKVYLGVITNEAQGNNSNKVSLQNFYKLNIFMIVSAIVGFFMIILLLPPAVEIILGERWLEAAKMGQIMAPIFCLGYLTTPLSMVMYVLKKQMDVLKFQVSYFLISLTSFIIGVILNDIYIALILFSALSSIRYLYIYFKIVSYTRQNGY